VTLLPGRFRLATSPASDQRHRRLLRPRCERPRGRTAENSRRFTRSPRRRGKLPMARHDHLIYVASIMLGPSGCGKTTEAPRKSRTPTGNEDDEP